MVDPNGHRKRVPVDPIPFLIGRQPENHLILRDSRVSRSHARIVVENGAYVLEDNGSRHGTFVNGKRDHSARRWRTRTAWNSARRIPISCCLRWTARNSSG